MAHAKAPGNAKRSATRTKPRTTGSRSPGRTPCSHRPTGTSDPRGSRHGTRGAASGSPQVTRFDLHAHGHHSPDARGSVKEMAKAARLKGVLGLAITDHNSIASHAEIREVARLPAFHGMILVGGIELSTADGHLLAIGVRGPVPDRLPMPESIDAVRAQGGVPVVSHPERAVNGAGARVVAAVASQVAAIEVFNAREYFQGNNAKAVALARKHALGGTGGSDGHNVVDVGNGYTVLPEPAATVDDLLDALEKRKTWGEGQRTPPGQIARQAARNLRLWVGRGFRKV